ncbi:ATP translocase [Kangiella geojedonensis]|uniref:ATP/ADP translocase-like protein n=1 Tax=Kangiella geojedonensis TaxID=914150 RepID=A0A0F6RBY4_9GAMM|nr:ATP translocase [Kangiella geojedonensis]AKE51566.1 ATP/ADP translocase-like protein [Kangiella geojedonensis]
MDKRQQYNLFERCLARFVWVRAGEGTGILLMFLSLFLLMLSYYLLKVMRDPLILSDGSAELKSYTTAAQASILLVVIPFFNRFYYKYSSHKDKSLFLRKVLIFFFTNLSLFIIANQLSLPIGIAFYIWLGVYSVIMVALFWAFCADCFNAMSGKRLFAVIAVGGTSGAWVGAKLGGFLFPLVGVTGVMLISASLLLCLNILTHWGYKAIPVASRGDEANKPKTINPDWWRGLSRFFHNRYLLLIAVFILLYNWVNSVGEYVLAKFVISQASEVSIRGSYEEQLFMTEFYSGYIAWFTLIGLLLQVFVVARLFRWIGVGASIFILPFVMVINYSLILFFPFFAVVKWALIAENSVNYSIQNTSRHALFLPVSREDKYLSKNAMDTFFYRFGDLMYGASVAIGVNVLGLGTFEFIAFNALLAGLCCWTALAIRKRYNAQYGEIDEGHPPVLSTVLKPHTVPAGRKSILNIPPDTFVEPDAGDIIRYKLKGANGAQLPAWCQFDDEQLTVALTPPKDHQNKLKLELVARDFAGYEVSTYWKITIKSEP